MYKSRCQYSRRYIIFSSTPESIYAKPSSRLGWLNLGLGAIDGCKEKARNKNIPHTEAQLASAVRGLLVHLSFSLWEYRPQFVGSACNWREPIVSQVTYLPRRLRQQLREDEYDPVKIIGIFKLIS
jgi:hypothetical protein